MKNRQIKLMQAIIVALLTIFTITRVVAEEKIIQQEKIPFEKCLKVITTSQNKLSIAPEVRDLLDQKRVAVFTLSDGTLTISCNGESGTITVSTYTN